MTALSAEPPPASQYLARAAAFPRLRYMGSKYSLLPHLTEVFATVGGTSALDAFSGSGVVSYLMKSMGYRVTSNDFLQFPGAITRATVVNQRLRLSEDLVNRICGPAADRTHNFIQDLYGGVFFTPTDLAFLDSAWSHIDRLGPHEQSLAIAALVLAAARKQPRGVFTFTGTRYDDGRRDLRISMEQHFRECVDAYNAVVFDDGKRHVATNLDVFDVDPTGYDLVYLDPPYAPPTDDADYMKRYHFLEGLSCYWRGQVIMPQTMTKKIEKKFTPFAYKHRAAEALRATFHKFAESTLVLSYSSNALPHIDVLEELLREVKHDVSIHRLEHRYHFGTHRSAQRRTVHEYLLVAR